MIEVEHLTKRFRSTTAVDDLSFSVPRGRITGFLGPNGAGKTTTLRVVLGLALPTSGRASVAGKRYRELDEPLKTVGAVLEASNYHPARSGRNQLRGLASIRFWRTSSCRVRPSAGSAATRSACASA